VLAVLDRRHGADSAVKAARLATLAGFRQVSLDVIYGTPGETPQSWRGTLDAVVATGVTHVSAYALKVEMGTALARRIARGEVASTDDDLAATCYEIADSVLSAAGLPWYEISNWAVPGHECRHNLGYWRGDDWWGVGPGAHSHVSGTRFWNLRHPTRWAQSLESGADPVEGREALTTEQAHTERVMLGVRLADGFDPVALVGAATAERVVPTLVERGLVEPLSDGVDGSRWRLTRAGRLLADQVTLELLDDERVVG
jgi:oxygen-independent coproporphyrinogen-3 oxidase